MCQKKISSSSFFHSSTEGGPSWRASSKGSPVLYTSIDRFHNPSTIPGKKPQLPYQGRYPSVTGSRSVPMHTKTPPGNPNPNRHMVAFYFLRALARISQTRAGRSSSSAQRGRRIKRAAYTSIALTAGPRRAWSRAILSSLRGRARCRVLSHRRVTPCKKRSTLRPGQKEGTSQVDELQRLVPGGRRMGLCSLLEEAGHYIQCLTAQVQLMKKIADSMSK